MLAEEPASGPKVPEPGGSGAEIGQSEQSAKTASPCTSNLTSGEKCAVTCT